MNTIFYMLQKEFLHVVRNRVMLPLIFVVPIVQLVLLGYAATLEIKNVDLYIIDNDNTTLSALYIDGFEHSAYFTITGTGHSTESANEAIAKRIAKMALIIPTDFEKDIFNGVQAKAQFLINAEDGSAAGIMQSYAAKITTNFIKNTMGNFHIPVVRKAVPLMEISERYLYNQELDYKQYMAPGILVILITFIGMLLTAMNIVKEKEIGTIEQLNVSPIKKYQFLIGKLLPYWLVGLFELAFGLFLAKTIFHLPDIGNIPLLFSLGSVYLIVVLAAGLLISTITETQQQAMFITWFFIVVFILMSGLFTPLESMPLWAQNIAKGNPIAYFVEIMRRVLLKGANFSEVQNLFYVLCAMAVLILSAAVFRYKKTN